MNRHPLLITLTPGVVATASAQSTWPQWRGPHRAGQFTGPTWPEKLSTNHVDQLWRVELGPIYSGPIVSGDRILPLDRTGTLHLLGANQERFDLLNKRKSSDNDTWAHLAVADDQLFVRELNALTAFRWSSHLQTTAPDATNAVVKNGNQSQC